jgi:hypothetical protein
MSVLSSFRTSHDEISVADISSISKKVEEVPSDSRRLVQSCAKSENSSAARVDLLLHELAIEQPSPQVSQFSHDVEPILLPFAARLGELPSSSFRQQAAKIPIQKSSASKHCRAEVRLNGRQQPRGLTSSRFHVALAVPRPKTAPDIAKSELSSPEVLSSRRHQVALRSGALAPHTVNSSQRRGPKPVRADGQVEVTESPCDNEESELQGADLEVLLKKQLQLVSSDSSSSRKFNDYSFQRL